MSTQERWSDAQTQARQHAKTLETGTSAVVPRYDPAMIAGLPGPVQRYFAYCLSPGAPIHSAGVLKMQGRFRFNEKGAWMPLGATQILKAPEGMVWAARIGEGLRRMQGSDGVLGSHSWTQFAWRNWIPLVHIHDTPDHYRSAVGRMLAEAVFWTPGALLTLLTPRWEVLDEQSIRATLLHEGVEVCVHITLGPEGEALSVCFERWSDANADKVYRLQPFGGTLSAYRNFDGTRIPTHVEAGNFFGTEQYFPFYRVEVQEVHWLDDSD